MKLSIVIPTHNRSDLLEKCLQSIVEPVQKYNNVEVLVIDNNSTDNTELVVKKLGQKIDQLKYYFEDKVGLSYARNTGIIKSKGEYILYLDDDALIKSDLIDETIATIEKYKYDIFGGRYIPWYYYGKPLWYRDEMGASSLKYSAITELKGNEFLTGGIMIVSRNVFQHIGSFNCELGMSGTNIGYGEETEFQIRAIERGYKLIYNPKIIIEHLVAKYKLNVGWHLDSYFKLGCNQVDIFSINISRISILKNVIILILMTLGSCIFSSIRLIFSRNYYIENWILDTFKKAAKRIGIIYTILRRMSL